jgi:hypothetical protein
MARSDIPYSNSSDLDLVRCLYSYWSRYESTLGSFENVSHGLKNKHYALSPLIRNAMIKDVSIILKNSHATKESR